jgi:hypothetical protein
LERKGKKIKPLGKIFSQGVFIVLLPLRNPQGRQQLQMLPALWISRNFVKKEKKKKEKKNTFKTS